jgi:hypothetical protein
MTQSHSIHMNPPWTLLHERPSARPALPRVSTVSEAERAISDRRAADRLESIRERTFRDLALCSRQYL